MYNMKVKVIELFDSAKRKKRVDDDTIWKEN
jgi:hypothetical protein